METRESFLWQLVSKSNSKSVFFVSLEDRLDNSFSFSPEKWKRDSKDLRSIFSAGYRKESKTGDKF